MVMWLSTALFDFLFIRFIISSSYFPMCVAKINTETMAQHWFTIIACINVQLFIHHRDNYTHTPHPHPPSPTPAHLHVISFWCLLVFQSIENMLLRLNLSRHAVCWYKLNNCYCHLRSGLSVRILPKVCSTFTCWISQAEKIFWIWKLILNHQSFLTLSINNWWVGERQSSIHKTLTPSARKNGAHSKCLQNGCVARVEGCCSYYSRMHIPPDFCRK